MPSKAAPAPTDPLAVLYVLFLILLITGAHTARAQQSGVIYGPDGRVSTRSVRGSDGTTTYYDATGRVVARSSPDSTGRVTVYGPDGRPAAQIEPPAGVRQ